MNRQRDKPSHAGLRSIWSKMLSQMSLEDAEAVKRRLANAAMLGVTLFGLAAMIAAVGSLFH